MVSRVSLGFSGVATAAIAIACAMPAQADEAYLCGPDKVVYVSAADLPAKKRTDPCIAAYYGLTVEDAAPAAQDSTSQASKAGRGQHDLRLAKAVQAELKPLLDNDVPGRASPQRQRQAVLEPMRALPHAMPGTDYRNVKILNAATPDNAWFRHTK